MGFNRIVDREFDKLNPRTATRALPANAVKISEAWAMVVLAAMLFFFACYNLNQLTLMLSPFALASKEMTRDEVNHWLESPLIQQKVDEYMALVLSDDTDELKFALNRLALPQQEVARFLLLHEIM